MTHVACRPNLRKTALGFQNSIDNSHQIPKHQSFHFQNGRSNFGLVNIQESESSHILQIAIPGYTKENITITLEHGKLTVSGSIESETTPKFHLKEFNNSTFSRTFRLPKEIQEDAIEAQVDNGILLITIPKAEKVHPKTINVL